MAMKWGNSQAKRMAKSNQPKADGTLVAYGQLNIIQCCQDIKVSSTNAQNQPLLLNQVLQISNARFIACLVDGDAGRSVI